MSLEKARQQASDLNIDFKVLEQFLPPEKEQLEVDTLLEYAQEAGQDMKRDQVIRLFKKLEKTGYGQYVVGRRGQPTRLEWNEQANERDENSGLLQNTAMAPLIDHKFFLRPTFEVSLQLPIDLTLEEAERLSNFVKTLPFRNYK